MELKKCLLVTIIISLYRAIRLINFRGRSDIKSIRNLRRGSKIKNQEFKIQDRMCYTRPPATQIPIFIYIVNVNMLLLQLLF